MVIASGLNYVGIKGQNVYKDNENNNIIFKKTTIIYPVGGCNDHIIITLAVADRMTYITDMNRSLMAMMVTMMVKLMVTLSYC